MPVAPENVIVSPAAPTNLNTNEDWIVVMNRASTPLVMAAGADRRGAAAAGRQHAELRLVLYAYVTLGVSRRPEGVGLVKGLTAPTY